jgi:SAM-dependent methyltransferase
MNKPHLLLAKDYWRRHLKPGDFAIDATCGNGHDTLFLSQLLSEGLVFGIDIQEAALQKTEKLLGGAKNVQLFRQSHADPIPVPKPPRLVVYNLGYLPGGDKSITTMTGSTLQSIRQSLSLLDAGGAISITCYPGHHEGMLEESKILAFIKNLKYTYHQWDSAPITTGHRRPSLLWIQT